MSKPVFQVDRVRAASSRLGDGARVFDFPGRTTVTQSRLSRNRADAANLVLRPVNQ